MEERIVDNVSFNRISNDDLIKYLEFFFLSSSILILEKRKNIDNSLYYKCEIDSDIYELSINIKSLSKSGWADRLDIRRIQVQTISNLPVTTNNSCYLLLGFCTYKDEPMCICWNANRYVFHKSNRSCYVDVSSIYKGFQNGYYFGFDHHREVFVSNNKNFDKLIKEYISYTYVRDIEW